MDLHKFATEFFLNHCKDLVKEDTVLPDMAVYTRISPETLGIDSKLQKPEKFFLVRFAPQKNKVMFLEYVPALSQVGWISSDFLDPQAIQKVTAIFKEVVQELKDKAVNANIIEPIKQS